MQPLLQPYDRGLALGDLVSLRALGSNPSGPELDVSVLHRVHGSSLWESIETGQRIRVAPKIGKNLKLVVQSARPIFDGSERCQVTLLQSTQYSLNEVSHDPDSYRVGATSPAPDSAVRMIDISTPTAPLQPPSPYRMEFDAKLLALHKGFRFLVRVDYQGNPNQVFCGVSPQFVAHNSGSSRESSEPKKKSVKPKANKKKPPVVKSSMPITPPEDEDMKNPNSSDSGSDTPVSPAKAMHVVEMDPIYPVIKEEFAQNDAWIVVGSNLFVDGRVNATSYVQFSDIRLKADVQDLADALSVVQNLSGRKYYWKDDVSTLERDAPKISRGGLKTIGVIAQEVQRVLPEAVEVTEEGWLSVEYTALVPVLVEALKTQLGNAKSVTEDVMKQLDEIGLQQTQLVASLAQLRERLAREQKNSPEKDNSGPVKSNAKGSAASGCSAALLRAIVLGSLLAILLALVLFLGLWFGWRPNALNGSGGSNSTAPTTSSDTRGSPGTLQSGAPTVAPSSPPRSPPSQPPILPPPPIDPNAPVAPPTAPPPVNPPQASPPLPAPAMPPVVPPPGTWRNQNYLGNGGYENPDATNSNQPDQWTMSGPGASWYDYGTNSTKKREIQDLLFPLLLNTSGLVDIGNKGIRFTRSLADRQSNVPVPSVTNAVPIRNILENVAFLNNLSLTQLLSGLLSGIEVGFWANWIYAPNNTFPTVNAPGLYGGSITLTLSKRVVVLGLEVKVAVASVNVPMTLAAATGPAYLRTWASFDTNLVFDLLTLPNIMDFTVSCDTIGPACSADAGPNPEDFPASLDQSKHI